MTNYDNNKKNPFFFAFSSMNEKEIPWVRGSIKHGESAGTRADTCRNCSGYWRNQLDYLNRMSVIIGLPEEVINA